MCSSDLDFELGADRRKREEGELAAIAAEFPDRETVRVFGGWESVPKGVTVIRTVTTTALLRNLRELHDRPGGTP